MTYNDVNHQLTLQTIEKQKWSALLLGVLAGVAADGAVVLAADEGGFVILRVAGDGVATPLLLPFKVASSPNAC